MDISKYIGLFLVKEEFCYLPGIGNFEVRKKSASFNKETETMDGPTYSVLFSQGRGAIDDSFANFIADNERISIAHAANYLSEWCHDTKEALKEGQEVTIPGIGTLNEKGNGEINYTPDPHLDIKGRSIPLFKDSPELAEKKENDLTEIIEQTQIREPKADEEIVIKPPTVNWVKVIALAIGALAILGGGGYFVYNFVKASQDANKPIVETPKVEEKQTPAVLPNDTLNATATNDSLNDANATTDPADQNGQPTSNAYFVAINKYPTQEQAQKRANQLKTYGNDAEVKTGGDGIFLVTIKVPSSINQQRAIDSLKRLYNPSGDVKVVQP